MDEESAGCAGFTVKFREEAGTVGAGGGNASRLVDKVLQFGMFVGPASGADLGPELRFFRTDDAHFYVFAGRKFLDGPVHYVADLNRAVATGTEQAERRDASKGAHFVEHLRAAVAEEALYYIQRVRGQLLKETESEGLRDRRTGAV